MSEINNRQDLIIKELNMFDDWMDKYEYLIELGKSLPEMDESKKTEENIIKGCQSNVWLSANIDDNKNIIFVADSDAIITKGIIALLIKVMSGLQPQEIVDAELYFLEKIGLKENLSPTRANGLVSMVKQIKIYALAYATKC